MNIKPSHFRKMIIDTLNRFNPALVSPEAVELLMMTAAHESHLGEYLYQNNSDFGPAIGFYQIEPATHREIFRIYFDHKYPNFKIQPDCALMDPCYSTIIARGIYANRPEPIPRKENIYGLADFYKRWFNSQSGDAKVGDVVKNYMLYAGR